MKKYIPYILILIAFFAGQLLGTQDKSGEELLKYKFEQERKKDRDRIHDLLARLAIKEGQSIAIQRKMKEDSLNFAQALTANKRAYSALQKKYYEINLRRANSSTLDSIVSRLYAE